MDKLGSRFCAKSCLDFAQSKLNELDNICDPIIPRGMDIHCFGMKKVGKGWKTISYFWSNTGVLYPYDAKLESVLSQHSTLSKIKDDFAVSEPNNYVICVIEGNLMAPSELYQLIIECQTDEQRDIVNQILRTHHGLNFTCLLKYVWIDQIPANELKVLLEY